MPALLAETMQTVRGKVMSSISSMAEGVERGRLMREGRIVVNADADM
jgi:hypothetical protein